MKWYQQNSSNSYQRRPVDPDTEDVFESEESQLLQERIQELEDELEELRGGQIGSPGEQKSLIEPLLEQLSDEDRQKVRAALRNAEFSEDEEREIREESKALTEETFSNFKDLLKGGHDEELEVQLGGASDQNAHLKRLNACLQKSAAHPFDKNSRKDLWISYERCKRLMPECLPAMRDKIWDTLWNSQKSGPYDVKDRASHLNTLSQDMLRSGKVLSITQQETLIETFIEGGRLGEALELWEKQTTQNTGKSHTQKEHASLGVRLFASQKNPLRAEEIAIDSINENDPESCRILIPAIEAWAEARNNEGMRKAWSLYLNLRKALGSRIKIEDYDAITMCFINAGRTDVALAVFKDMMLSGEQAKCDSTELYKTSLTLIKAMQSKTMDPTEIITVSLTALMTLPKQFQNKFFYGSWIKKLIGMGEINAAASVTELMYERGVKPDAKHLNGIVGAWLRDGSKPNKVKAEQMGWAMIQERLDFVRKRRSETLDLTVKVDQRERFGIPVHLQRTVPPATIETFSLLLLYYERRSNSDMVELLKKHLELAEIPPNSYFMNHLLYAELRKNRCEVAWDIYQGMKAATKPDLETFACLWDCQKAYLGQPFIPNNDLFPGPRQLFAEMMTWCFSLSKSDRKNVGQEFSEDLYNQILRCLSLAADLEGILVALYALRASFSFRPNNETLSIVPMQVARMASSPTKTAGRRQRFGRSDPASQRRLTNISRLLDLIVDQRATRLEREGVKLEECDKTRQQDEQLFILADLIRLLLARSVPDETTLKAKCEVAARQMAVDSIVTEPTLLYNH